MLKIPYTAGPWHADKKSDGFTIYGPRGEWPIADIEHGSTSAGDAQIIAAAPEMLAALLWASQQLTYHERIRGQNDEWCDKIDAMNAAIVKATGFNRADAEMISETVRTAPTPELNAATLAEAGSKVRRSLED